MNRLMKIVPILFVACISIAILIYEPIGLDTTDVSNPSDGSVINSEQDKTLSSNGDAEQTDELLIPEGSGSFLIPADDDLHIASDISRGEQGRVEAAALDASSASKEESTASAETEVTAPAAEPAPAPEPMVEAAPAPEAAAEPAPAPAPEPTPAAATESTAASQASVSDENLDLLARLITAEAQGEPYEAQVAIGAVVLNRIESGVWADTIKGVIYQKSGEYYQFTPVVNGWIDKPATTEAIQAAKDALNGADPSNGSQFYYDDKCTNEWILAKPVSIQIGHMIFAY